MSYDILEGIALHIPLEGRTVLGLGSYDGRHVATCLGRGAASVTVVDSGQWRLYGWSPPEQLPGVVYREMDLMDWHEPADIVEWANCWYHCRDPWGAMEHIRSLTKECLCLTTSFVAGDDPILRICDPHTPRQSWYKPTLPALFLMLRETGFGRWEEVGRSGDHWVGRCYPT